MTNRTPVLLLWNQITSSRITYLIVMTLVGLSFLVGSIIYEIPIVVYAVSGGIFGTFCSAIVLVSVLTTLPEKRGTPMDLLFWRAFCDFGVGMRFMTNMWWGLYECGELNCNYLDGEAKCALPSALLEFFELSSEAWFLCVAVDLMISVTNPFSSSQQRMQMYHTFSWTFGMVMALILYFDKDLFGYWYISDEVDGNAFCFIQSHYSAHSFNLRPWIMFYIPLLLVFSFSIYSLYFAYQRLRHGITKTFQHRVRLLVVNAINIAVYTFYWAVVLLLYGLVNELNTPDAIRASRWLYRILLFSLSAKGYPDLVVWILASDNVAQKSRTDSTAADQLERNPEPKALLSEFNVALRGEVLQFATSGIRASAIRSSKVAENYKKTVITMIHRDDSNSSSTQLTAWVFLRLIFGSKSELNNVTTMISESDTRGRCSEFLSDDLRVESAATGDSGVDRLAGRYKASGVSSDDDSAYSGVSNPMRHSSSHVPIKKKGPRSSSGQASGISYYDPEMDTYIGRISDVTEFGGKDIHTIEECSDNGAGGLHSMDSTAQHESKSILSTISNYFRECYLTFTDQEAGHVKSNRVRFTEFHPFHFRLVRTSSGVSDDEYRKAFRHTIKERLTEGGASGAFFFFSSNETFIAKSCTEEEMETLVRNAYRYSNYMHANPDSFITKIYGAYKLHMYGTDINFFVMNNIFLNDQNDVINEKYDLKGSWVARNATPPQDGKSCLCSYCNQTFIYRRRSKGSNMVNKQKHKSSLSSKTTIDCPVPSAETDQKEQHEERCPMTVGGYHEPNVILKDNDLKHKIRLPTDSSKTVLTQLTSDADLLLSMGVMDYSLLVGVHNTEYAVEQTIPEEDTSETTDALTPLMTTSRTTMTSSGHSATSLPMKRLSLVSRGPSSKANSPFFGGGEGSVSEKGPRLSAQLITNTYGPPSATKDAAGSTADSLSDYEHGGGIRMSDTPPPSQHLASSVSSLAATSDASRIAALSNRNASKRWQVSSVVGPEAYYIGIVDFQQEWTIWKQLEQLLKVHLTNADIAGVSSVEPVEYRNRFVRRVEDLLDLDIDDNFIRASSRVHSKVSDA